jgi:hypothetical protein
MRIQAWQGELYLLAKQDIAAQVHEVQSFSGPAGCGSENLEQQPRVPFV